MVIMEVEYEKYDKKTPRLDYGQVAAAIHRLPTPNLEKLMLGPFEEDSTCGTCNACDALEDLTDNSDAELLIEWHDHIGYSEDTKKILRDSNIGAVDWEFIRMELTEVLGTMAYAKCCTIYALARVEVMERRAAT